MRSEDRNGLTALVVEDHPLFSGALVGQLEQAGFTVNGVATTEGEGLALYHRHRSALVLCDVRLADGSSGIELTRKITGQYPGAVVLMVSAENEGHVVQEAYEAGAVGYVSKSADAQEILQAIAEVMRGEKGVADRSTYRKLVIALQAPRQGKDGVRLTPRERDVLNLLAQGTTTNAALAQALGIAQSSVRTHVDGLRNKTQAHSRAEILARGYQLGLIEPPAPT